MNPRLGLAAVEAEARRPAPAIMQAGGVAAALALPEIVAVSSSAKRWGSWASFFGVTRPNFRPGSAAARPRSRPAL